MSVAWVPAALTVAGTALSAKGARDAGAAERVAGERRQAAAAFEAEQLRQKAGQEIAASQRAALEETRKADLVQSRAIALAAASGAGVSDPTVVSLLARNKGEGAYRAAVALYEGEDRARTLRLNAQTRDYEGRGALEAGLAREAASRTAGTASMLRGASSLYDRYGRGGSGGTGGGLGYGSAGSADPTAGGTFEAGAW